MVSPLDECLEIVAELHKECSDVWTEIADDFLSAACCETQAGLRSNLDEAESRIRRMLDLVSEAKHKVGR